MGFTGEKTKGKVADNGVGFLFITHERTDRMKKILIKRSQNTSFTNISKGYLFQFVGTGDRTTYVMIDNYHGTYKKRTGNDEVLTIGDDTLRSLMDTDVVEVFFMEPLTDSCQRGFDALLAKAKTLGWPSNWFDDLWIHDRIMLSVNKPTVFGWSVRDTGTHMMTPNSVYSYFLTEMYKREEAKGGEDFKRNRFYFWNGNTLKEMTINRIHDRLVDAGCSKAKQFSRCGWHVKNSTTLAGEWQKEIDAELNCPRELAVA